jgi:hypothetical protein
MKAPNIKAVDAMRDMTITVRITGMKELRLRLWIGVRLVRLAARIMGMGIEVV